MPFSLCRPIRVSRQAQWGEGPPYETMAVYRAGPTEPPVHYDTHVLRPHSLCHAETLKHVDSSGPGIEEWCDDQSIDLWFGPVVVLKVRSPQWVKSEAMHVHTISQSALTEMLRLLGIQGVPRRLLISCDPMPKDTDGYHSAQYALVFDLDAAQWLAQQDQSLLVGTSYRSLDFQPGSRERPIHRTLLARGVALELLDLDRVPEGHYILASLPIPLAGGSESLVSPVLFTFKEWADLARL